MLNTLLSSYVVFIISNTSLDEMSIFNKLLKNSSWRNKGMKIMDCVTNLMKHFSLKEVVDVGAILIKNENMWMD